MITILAEANVGADWIGGMVLLLILASIFGRR